MNAREQAAFNAGVEAMRQMAMAAAVTLETRADAREVRQQAAAVALQGLAEGSRALILGTRPDPMHSAFKAIESAPGSSGEIECPVCNGRLAWIRDSHNGHLHGECETNGCLRWMQ